MKKINTILVALTLFAAMLTQSCDSSSDKLDKFIGEWKRTDKIDDHLTIMKEDGGIVIKIGKNKIAAVYDKNKNIIRTYLAEYTMTIRYIEKNDHLFAHVDKIDLFSPFNNVNEGEYERVN